MSGCELNHVRDKTFGKFRDIKLFKSRKVGNNNKVSCTIVAMFTKDAAKKLETWKYNNYCGRNFLF